MNRTSRIVIGGAVIGSVLFGGTAVAVAQEDPSSEPSQPTSQPAPSGSVTITLSPEQVTFLCDQRLPRIEKRTSRLVDRIQGDADTRGSAAWLRARADRERDAGRETTAQLLEERADRREGHVDQLNKINKWATDFSTQHCGSK
jgi:fermentation-respiration switch protein FrsA (DUF1100 family)